MQRPISIAYMVITIDKLEFTIKALAPDWVRVVAWTPEPANNIISISKNNNNNPDRASIHFFINIQDAGGATWHRGGVTHEKSCQCTSTSTLSLLEPLL